MSKLLLVLAVVTVTPILIGVLALARRIATSLRRSTPQPVAADQ